MAKNLSQKKLSDVFNDRYKIILLLGGEILSQVFLVEDLQFNGALLALKKIKKTANKQHTRLQQEFLYLKNFDHPAFPKAYEFGKDKYGSVYFTMEYIKSESISTLAQGASFDAILEFTLQIVDALAYLHYKNILHRDLKPENLLWNPLISQAYIIDFGFAENMADSSNTNIHLGTPFYTAPEIIAGQQADARSDLYSLGIILYELLSGSLPFVDPNSAIVLQQHIDKPIPPIQSRFNIPEDFISIIHKLLSKNPDDRFYSATELLDSLEPLSFKYLNRLSLDKRQYHKENEIEIKEELMGAIGKQIEIIVDSSDRLNFEIKLYDEYIKLGQFYHSHGTDRDLAKKYAAKSLKIAEKLEHDHRIAQSCYVLGRIYEEQGQFEKAIDSYLRNLSIVNQIKEYDSIGQVLFRLGNVWFLRNEPLKANFYLSQAQAKIKKSEKLENHLSLLIWTLKAQCHIQLNEIEVAEELFQQAMNNINEETDLFLRGYVQIYYAEFLFTKNNFKESEVLFLKAFDLIQKYGPIFDKALACLNYGKFLLNTKKQEMALLEIEKSKYIFSKIKSDYFLKKASLELSRLDKENNNSQLKINQKQSRVIFKKRSHQERNLQVINKIRNGIAFLDHVSQKIKMTNPKAEELIKEKKLHWQGLDNKEIEISDKEIKIKKSINPKQSIWSNTIVYTIVECKQIKNMEETINQEAKLNAIGDLAARITERMNALLHSIQKKAKELDKKLNKEPYSEYLHEIVLESNEALQYTTKHLYPKRKLSDWTLTNIGVVINESVVQLKAEAELNKVNIKTILKSAQDKILVQSDEIKEVIINLIRNAIQAQKKGGQVIIKTYDHFSPGAKKEIIISVQDRGHGIPMEHKTKIFEPFFTTKEDGHGIGLWTVHNTIRNHQGKIDLHSEPGKGTTFTISLPV